LRLSLAVKLLYSMSNEAARRDLNLNG